MKQAQPRGLSRRRVEQLLSRTKYERSAGNRIEILSRHFLGYPYIANPLTGSATEPEELEASIDAFDCVTYVETVMALTRASDSDQFVKRLKTMRYDGGRVQWNRRNHYMTDWIRSNRRGKNPLQPLSPPGVARVAKQRTLTVVPELPARPVRFECVPKPGLRKLSAYLKTGDLIFFASTRAHLDVFHCGILVRQDGRLLLRHASRTHGGVVEQELNDFVKANRMAGVIVVRP